MADSQEFGINYQESEEAVGLESNKVEQRPTIGLKYTIQETYDIIGYLEDKRITNLSGTFALKWHLSSNFPIPHEVQEQIYDESLLEIRNETLRQNRWTRQIITSFINIMNTVIDIPGIKLKPLVEMVQKTEKFQNALQTIQNDHTAMKNLMKRDKQLKFERQLKLHRNFKQEEARNVVFHAQEIYKLTPFNPDKPCTSLRVLLHQIDSRNALCNIPYAYYGQHLAMKLEGKALLVFKLIEQQMTSENQIVPTFHDVQAIFDTLLKRFPPEYNKLTLETEIELFDLDKTYPIEPQLAYLMNLCIKLYIMQEAEDGVPQVDAVITFVRVLPNILDNMQVRKIDCLFDHLQRKGIRITPQAMVYAVCQIVRYFRNNAYQHINFTDFRQQGRNVELTEQLENSQLYIKRPDLQSHLHIVTDYMDYTTVPFYDEFIRKRIFII